MAAHKRAPGSRLGFARPADPHGGRRGVSPKFKALIERHEWRGKAVVDIGCGSGAATLLLTRLGARAVGVDLDPVALVEANERAKEEGVEGARFVCADAEAVDYRVLAGGVAGLDGVVAHLCFSDRIAKRAAHALLPGGVFIVRSFHNDQWKESNFESPFAFEEREVRALLTGVGLRVTHLEVERRTQRFDSLEDFMEKFLADPERRAHWQEDGRLDAMRASFDGGRRTLHEAFLVVEAVKQAPSKPPRKGAKKTTR